MQNERCYLEDPDTVAALRSQNSTLDELLSDFVNAVHDTVRRRAKTPVVWEEMVLNHDLRLGQDVIVTVWINSVRERKVNQNDFRERVALAFG